MLKQKTLKDSFSLSGKGLHTGLDLTVTFNPAPDNHGYKIQRIDLEGQPTFDAVADNVSETTRGTVISKNGVKVSTVEHGMAALYALGIDNCLIQVNGPEFPILDGSAQYYVNEIERVGTVEQNAVKDFYIIKSKIEFRDETTGSSIIVLPDENFSLNVLVSYDSNILPNQFATLEDMTKFKDEVAASRTFVFVREIEPLLQAGLIKGGDWFVDGATGIARRFHVPELLIGATVVSIGTTLPEVMVSTTSALTGHGEIAYGNAIGSVICNSALIAAITIAVRPGKVDPKSLRTPVAFFFVAAAFYAGVAYTTGSFTRPVGLILLAMFVAYIVCNVLAMKNTPAPEEEEQAEEGSFAKELGLLAIGAVLIAVGADLLVDNGTLIAQALGVPESVIALTFVALGTSLPELVTAITSLAKGHGALSLGNVIGANVFNLVLVSGVSVTLAPFSIPQNSTIAGMNASLVMDIPVMFAVMLLLTLPALIKGKLSRPQGIALLCIYAAFCAVQFSI